MGGYHAGIPEDAAYAEKMIERAIEPDVTIGIGGPRAVARRGSDDELGEGGVVGQPRVGVEDDGRRPAGR